MVYLFKIAQLSNLRYCFSLRVVNFYESGLLQVWVKKWWPQQTFCRGSLLTQARALSLIDMQSSFYVLAIGVSIAAVVLVLEAAFKWLGRFSGNPRWQRGGAQTTTTIQLRGIKTRSFASQSHQSNRTR